MTTIKNTITYAIEMDTNKTYTIDADKYEERCKTANCFEWIPSTPIKFYLDVDIKKTINEAEDCCLLEEAERLLDGLLNCLQLFFADNYNKTKIAITTSHSSSYIPNGKTEPCAKLSFGIIINNIIATSSQQKLYVLKLNEFAKQHIDNEDITMFYNGNVFDEAPYSNEGKSQKIRSVFANKPNEKRPKILIQGTFKQACITAFIPEYAYELPRIEQEPKIAREIINTIQGDNYDKLLIQKAIDEGLLTKYSVQYGDWIKVGWAIKNLFDDRELFHTFSKLGGKAYDRIACNDEWDKMNKKDYGVGMGSLVKMMQEIDKPKTKQIQQYINELKREDKQTNAKLEKLKLKQSKEQAELQEIQEEDERVKSLTQKWNENFEKEWCKIKNEAVFLRQFTDNTGKINTIFLTESQLITSYRHETYEKTVKGQTEKIAYVMNWLKEPTMRCYDTIQCIPPPLVCPDNIFNLWIPSIYESQPITKHDIDFNRDAVASFAFHLKTLCGNDEGTFIYVANWIAHSIQKPAEKVGIALNFISEEGTGKNIFTNALTELYGGNSKKLETANPERDVWGNFNELMASSYFVILNETDKRNTHGYDGTIKACITDETITINPKGKKPFSINSYHRYILNSNTEDPTKTHGKDRRNTIIRCSDENVGNTKYFNDLIAMLNSENAMRSIYWSFKSMDISNFKKGVPHITNYHRDIIQYNTNPLKLFMCWFIENNTGIVEVNPTELLRIFTTWRVSNNFKFGDSINSLSLLKKIKLELKVPDEYMTVKKGRMGNTRLFDTEKLAQFFKMESLEMNEETDEEFEEV